MQLPVTSKNKNTKYVPYADCDMVINLMSKGKSVTQVAAALGIARKTFYHWYKDPNKPEFKEAVDIGMTMSEAYWEDMGRQGTTGELAGFKPASWIYTMKCRFRDTWADRTESDININKVQALSEDELNQRIAAMEEERKKRREQG